MALQHTGDFALRASVQGPSRWRGKGPPARQLSVRVPPDGLKVLHALLGRCEQLSSPPAPSSAEDLFLSAEAKRQNLLNAPALSLIRQSCSGDREVRALCACPVRAHLTGRSRTCQVLRKFAEAQAQRQLNATCRRRWKQLGVGRQYWERTAKDERAQWERNRSAVDATTKLALSLSSHLHSIGLGHPTNGAVATKRNSFTPCIK